MNISDLAFAIQQVTITTKRNNPKALISNIPGMHFLDIAEIVSNMLNTTSERKLAADLGISKTEVNRLSQIARLSSRAQRIIQDNHLDKWFAYELAMVPVAHYPYIIEQVAAGVIKTRMQLRHELLKRRGLGK